MSKGVLRWALVLCASVMATCSEDGGGGGQANETPRCGDGRVDPGEECDSGMSDSAQCDYDGGDGNQACTRATCGDGYTNAEAGEACDDGPTDSNTCNYANGLVGTACTAAVCGDTYVNSAAGEFCDSGAQDAPECNYDDGDGPFACLLGFCGDGYVNVSADEECDDGNVSPNDACDERCLRIFDFEDPTVLTPEDTSSFGSPHFAVGGRTVAAVWTASFDVYGSRSTDDGDTWSAATPVVSSNTIESRPVIATDGAGNWVAFWDWISGSSADGGASVRSFDRRRGLLECARAVRRRSAYRQTDRRNERCRDLARGLLSNPECDPSAALDGQRRHLVDADACSEHRHPPKYDCNDRRNGHVGCRGQSRKSELRSELRFFNG